MRKYCEQITLLQNRAMRTVCYTKYNAHTEPLFKMSNVLKFNDLYDTKLLIFYHKLLNNNICCCLPTPMILASGGSPMYPLVVHHPASPSIWPVVQSHLRGLSTNPEVTMWCVCGCS